jgi:hypothetical protein
MAVREPSPYEVLGVARDAGDAEIDQAVDTAVDEGPLPVEQVHAAAAVLRDPARRLEWDMQDLLPPEPVDEAGRLLDPVAAEPLPFPPRAPLDARDLLAVHRAELEAEYAEPPAPPAGFPGIPERFTVDMSVLPPIELPR